MAYTKDQLFAKLQKADAAGDIEAAKVIASEIRKLDAAPVADAAPVQSGANPQDLQARMNAGDAGAGAEFSQRMEASTGQPYKPQSATEDADGSFLGANFNAAAGSTLGDTANGLMQLGIEGGPIANQARSLIEMTGLELPENPLKSWIDKRITDKRSLDADLLESEGGTRGAIAGNLAQLVGPGALAKAGATLKIPGMSSIASGLAPTSYAGNAALGGVIGAAQPTVEGESRAMNAAMGAGMGVAGRATGDVIRSPFIAGRYLKDMLSTAGAQGRVADDLVRAGVPVNVAMRQAPLPEFELTAAQATGDPIIAALTRARNSKNPQFMTALTQRLGINQAQANKLLDDLAGSESDLAASMAARQQKAGPLYRQAERAKGVDVSSVIKAAERGEKRLSMAPGSQANMREVVDLLKQAQTQGGRGFDLNVLRQTLGDMVAGKGTNASFAQKTADRNILPIKTRLEATFGKQVPEFKNAQDAFRGMSGDVNQRQVLQEIQKRATDPNGDITLGGLTRALKADKALVKSQTGLKNKRLSDILTAEQRERIYGVRDYLRMQNEAQNLGRGGNSPTAQNLTMVDEMTSQSINYAKTKLPLLRSFGEYMDAKSKAAYEKALDNALESPSGLQEVLNKLNPAQRKKAMDILKIAPQSGGVIGSASAGNQ